MIVLTVLAFVFILFSYQLPFTPSVTADVLPAFVGFLLLWYVGEKLEKRNKTFKKASVAAAAMAAVTFIGYASAFRELLPRQTTFADSDIFRFIFTGVGFVFENGAMIFTALGFIPIILFCLALKSAAEEKGGRAAEIICLIFTWIFVILIPVYVIFNFAAQIIPLWYFTSPIFAVFILISAIIMKKYELD